MSMQQIMFASLASGGGFVINGSGLFGGTTSDFLDGYVPSTPTDNNVWTYEAVVKLSAIGTIMSLLDSTVSDTNQAYIRINSNGLIRVFDYNSSPNHDISSYAVLRDPSAYYSIIVSFNSGESSATDRVKIWINGTAQTTQGTAPSLNAASFINTSGREMNIGNNTGGSVDSMFDGYFARATFIDGQALDPTSFGEITDEGFYQLNDVSDLNFGNNGFLLTGGSAISAGTDSSGNDNDFSKAGSIISTSDSPTSGGDDNEYGNYATLNPLVALGNVIASTTLSNGNLTTTTSSASGHGFNLSTIPVSGGKWYCEITCVTKTASNMNFGAVDLTSNDLYTDSNSYVGSMQFSYGYTARDDKISNNATQEAYGNAPTWGAGDVIGIALDLDNGAIWFSKNDVWIDGNGTDSSSTVKSEIEAGTTSSSAFATLSTTNPFVLTGGTTNGGKATLNYGATAFAGSAPSGFKTINTANLPTPAIINPDDHFHSQIVAKSGTTTTFTLPDWITTYEYLIIIKNTTGAVEKWYWIDSLRGVTKILSSNATTAETTDANVYSRSGTTGTLGSTLTSGKNYLIEIHKAGLTSATASNEDGSINTTATSVNTTSGFSLSTYTGTATNATIGHGLSSAPDFIICKDRDTTRSWPVYHSGNTDAPETEWLKLEAITATGDYPIWNDTAPTSSVFSIGTDTTVNGNTLDYVTYNWHSVDGYSSFGSYEGNSSATDGPMISVGFHPKCALYKWIDGGDSWVLYDDAFDPINGVGNRIHPNKTNIVADGIKIDRLSNGSKIYSGDGAVNSSSTLIYCYWGGQPMTDGSVDQSRGR